MKERKWRSFRMTSHEILCQGEWAGVTTMNGQRDQMPQNTAINVTDQQWCFACCCPADYCRRYASCSKEVDDVRGAFAVQTLA